MRFLDGIWGHDHEPDTHRLVLGSFFTGVVKPGTGKDDGYWLAFLNGQPLAPAHRDIDYAKGRVEHEIVNQMYNVRHAYRDIKTRAPTSTDLYVDGAWARFKAKKGAAT